MIPKYVTVIPCQSTKVATAIVTALLAVVVFVLTQGFLKLVLEPLQEERRLVGEVAAALTVYERAFTLRVQPSSGSGTEPMVFGSSREEAAEAAKALRDLSGRLQAGLWAVPLYDLFAFFRIVPTVSAVVVATDELHMWYSQLPNAVNEHQAQHIREARDTISKSLGIERRLQIFRSPGTPSDHP
jgi:hypothetical protein